MMDDDDGGGGAKEKKEKNFFSQLSFVFLGLDHNISCSKHTCCSLHLIIFILLHRINADEIIPHLPNPVPDFSDGAGIFAHKYKSMLTAIVPVSIWNSVTK